MELRCRWRGGMDIITCGKWNPQVAQRELQASVFWMVVVPNAEGDVDGISCQERGLLETLSHVPAQCIEGNLRAEINSCGSCLRLGERRRPIATPDPRAIGIATRRREDGGRREFGNGFCTLPRPELQLHVLLPQDSRRCDELHSLCGEDGLGIGHPIRLQQL